MQADDARLKTLVETVHLFHGLSTGDVQKIFAAGLTMRAQPKDTIFFKDTVGNQMYVVLGGKIGIYDGPRLLAELGVGDAFGEMSLLLGRKRNATAIALEQSMLFVLDEEIFQKLLTKKAAIQILLNLARALGERLSEANKEIRRIEGH
ncbi:MAG: cyclic nucleotide-binding domain-containing protein [Candidatus Hydrogenedentales bacterium]